MSVEFAMILILLTASAVVVFSFFHNHQINSYNQLLAEKLNIFRQQKEFIEGVKIETTGNKKQSNLTEILTGLYKTLNKSYGPFVRMSLFCIYEETTGRLISIVSDKGTSLTSGTAMNIENFRSYRTIAMNKIYVENDLESVSEKSVTDQVLYHEGIRSYMCKPLFRDGKLVGMINISSSKKNHFTGQLVNTINEAFEPIEVSFSLAIDLLTSKADNSTVHL
jgi:transcriptional regulator with GAF, ATPase, and Fis domain